MTPQDASSGAYKDMGGAQNTIVGAGAGRGRGVRRSVSNACYDFQAGNCKRGASCRFLHLTQ